MAHDHGHDSHGGHSHDDDHGKGGHADDHAHGDHGGHGHAEHWGDYNAQPPGPNSLPPLSRLQLAAFGVLLALLLGAIVRTSIALANAKQPVHTDTHAAHPTKGEGAEPEKKAGHH